MRTMRLRDLPRSLEQDLRRAFEPAVDSDWCVTISRSHVDGELFLDLEGRLLRTAPDVAPIDETGVRDLDALLRRLSAATAARGVRAVP